MDCQRDSPTCMRVSLDGDGVCTHTCDAGGDCGEDIRCKMVDLEERDESGMPLQAGYCMPQSFIDAKKAQRKAH